MTGLTEGRRGQMHCTLGCPAPFTFSRSRSSPACDVPRLFVPEPSYLIYSTASSTDKEHIVILIIFKLTVASIAIFNAKLKSYFGSLVPICRGRGRCYRVTLLPNFFHLPCWTQSISIFCQQSYLKIVAKMSIPRNDQFA